MYINVKNEWLISIELHDAMRLNGERAHAIHPSVSEWVC